MDADKGLNRDLLLSVWEHVEVWWLKGKAAGMADPVVSVHAIDLETPAAEWTPGRDALEREAERRGASPVEIGVGERHEAAAWLRSACPDAAPLVADGPSDPGHALTVIVTSRDGLSVYDNPPPADDAGAG